MVPHPDRGGGDKAGGEDAGHLTAQAHGERGQGVSGLVMGLVLAKMAQNHFQYDQDDKGGRRQGHHVQVRFFQGFKLLQSVGGQGAPSPRTRSIWGAAGSGRLRRTLPFSGLAAATASQGRLRTTQ